MLRCVTLVTLNRTRRPYVTSPCTHVATSIMKRAVNNTYTDSIRNGKVIEQVCYFRVFNNMHAA